ncbi:MAG: GDSL-type esterase/lipase family protein [Verrucomicrobia bacterium]|nr:GDSL-type esterase/lipase family protein [Verrucomicrobiota bacterium]
MKIISTCFLAVLASTVAFASPITPPQFPVADGQKIAFLGDSITEQGAGPQGYVTLVIKGLEANKVSAIAIPAGKSGHKSNDMLARVDRDVISKKPDWMTLSCGVNDVWHGPNGVPLDKYQENITKIVDKAQAAYIKVVILTSTMINEDQSNEPNQRLAAYNDFLRTLAIEKGCLLADLNADMQAGLTKLGAERKDKYYTYDGVHMGPIGNEMMATGVLRGMGLTPAQLEIARSSWKK